MTVVFPSVNGLTWQEWRANTFPMESTENPAYLAVTGCSSPIGADGVCPTDPFDDDEDELDFIEELRELADSGEDDRTCYFIGGDEGPVKIGYATNPKNRLQELRCAHWIELRILATATGGIYRERYYHIIFENWRMRGEWFERCPEIEAEIERLNG